MEIHSRNNILVSAPTGATKTLTGFLSILNQLVNTAEANNLEDKVADLAESEGHHPDFKINWNKVTLTLSTHSIKGLSENDFIMAAKINAFQQPTSGIKI